MRPGLLARSALLLATLPFGACGGDQEFADALPTLEQVRLDVPGSTASAQSASTQGLGVAQQGLVGVTAEFYQITWGVSASVNLGTAALVGALRLITLNRATSSTLTSRTWGPHTPGGLDPLSYRLVVTKLGTGHFGFSLDGRAKDSTSNADFVALIDGEVTKGVRKGTGKGTMSLHFDNRRTLLPDACEAGTIVFDFDNTGDPVRNDVILQHFANANSGSRLCKQDEPAEAVYHFDQDTSGAGNFTFTFTQDVFQPAGQPTTAEALSIRSRWKASGEGRSDVIVGGGEVDGVLASLGLAAPATASQCWDRQFKTSYETSTPTELHLIDTAGDPTACVFSSAELP